MENPTRCAGSPAAVSPRLQLLSLCSLAVIGIGLRSLGLDRALWIDEAWVLDSIHSNTWHDMFYYRGWAQTTPPGVLLLLRAYASATGAQAEALRVVPWLASCITLVLALLLVRRVLSFSFALVAAVVLSVSPELLWYGTEIKQYAFDLLAATALLTAGLNYLALPSQRRLWAWFAVYVGCAPFSYTLNFFLPTLLVVAVLVEHREAWPSGRLSLLLAILLASAVTAALYFGVARPNAAVPTLHAFWHRGFFHSAGLSLPYYIYRLSEDLFSFLPNACMPRAVLTLLTVLTVIGAVGGARARDVDSTRRWTLGLLLALPIVTTLGANALGIYPASDFRLLNFLVINCLLLSLLGLQRVSDGLAARLFLAQPAHASYWPGLLAALAMTIAYGERSTHTEFVNEVWHGNMDVRSVVHYLHARNALSRPVFVQSALRQYFAVYGRVYPLSGPLLQGEVGWPCCIPGRSWHRPEYTQQEIEQEVRALRVKLGDTSFYAVIRSNKSPTPEASLYEAAWLAAGCGVSHPWESMGMKLLLVDCARTTH